MKIGLLDHMGYGNLGDAAIQEAVIANIKKRLPDARLVGFSLNPDDTVMRHGIPCYPIRRWYPRHEKTTNQAADRVTFKSRLKSVLKNNFIVYNCVKPVLDFAREAVFLGRSFWELRRLDLLIISGGGQLGELWRGPWSHPYTIFKFCLLTKLAGKKLYFLNVGAGPLEHPLSRFFARCALRLADYRSFRDDDSQQLVRSLGVKAKMHVYPDPAYGLELGDQLKSAAHGASMPTVGLNPIGFCDPRIWPRKDDSLYQEYLEKVTRFSAWLLEQGYILRVFTTEISVDRYAVEDLKARLRSRLSRPELVCQVFGRASASVKDVLLEMSEFDFIVTSKFHGIIFSHLLSKPVISLSYHRKIDVAMRSIGQGHFCADIEHFDLNWLIKAFRTLADESESIKSRSAAAVEAYSATLSQQFDSLFLSGKSQLDVNSRPSSVRKSLLDQVSP
jgi:polysaccharide pyruvyl transferase WcaK-like protein